VPGVGKVYTDAKGMTLYSPVQEASGKILCTGECVHIWVPLAAPAGGSLTKSSGVSGALSVIDRPDGIKQVALDGMPLYTFFQDMAPGTVNGNGIADSFGGQHFTWHVDSGSGAVATSPPSSSGYPGY
jgi:predicted lipoprotein with Yx(FWY)xxD motif